MTHNARWRSWMAIVGGWLFAVSNAYAGCGTDPPVATILSPAPGASFAAGDTIAFAGSALDRADGPALPPAFFTWEVELHDGDTSRRFLAPTTGIASGSFVVPTLFEGSAASFFRIVLTVRNPCGIRDVASRDVRPRVGRLHVETLPSGLLVTVDGEAQRAPFTLAGIAGATRRVGIPAGTQTSGGVAHAFASWSDGGEATHEVVMPAGDTSLVATFAPDGSSTCVTARSGAGFQSRPLGLGAVLGPVTVAFAVRPSAAPMNALVGLSRGPAASLNGLGAIVRFNPEGRIDARDGAAYAAAVDFPYRAGTTYNVRMVVNVLARRYSVFVRPDGAAAETPIGLDFRFRTEQGAALALDHWAAWVGGNPAGTLTVCDVRVTADPCFGVARPAWLSRPMAGSQSGRFEAELEATPAQSPTNSVIGLARGAATAYDRLACAVRFNPAGTIDARDGALYRADAAVPFQGGATYRFRLAVDVPAKTYSVFVRRPGIDEEVVVARDYAFRTEQNGVAALDTWGAYVATAGHRTTLCGLQVSTPVECRLSLSPASQAFEAQGGTGVVTVTAEATSGRAEDCAWTAAAADAFLTVVAGASGRGDGAFSFTVGPNAGPARAGAITVGDATFDVKQQGAIPE